MKNNCLAACSAMLACTLLFNTAMAQAEYAVASQSIKEILPAAFNAGSVLNMAPPSPDATPVPTENVGEKVRRSFSNTYKNASNPTWYRMDKRTYFVTFNSDGRNSQAAFSRNGYMNYAVSYGNQKNLPKEVQRSLRSHYIDYKIGSVFEVTLGGNTIWIANLDDADNFVVVQSTDGALDELEHLQKQYAVKKPHRTAKVVVPK